MVKIYSLINSTSSAPYKVYNIENNNPVKLMDFITDIENKLGKTISKNMMPIQAGDVPATFANVTDLIEDLDYNSETPIQEGINKFVDWYLDFFKHDKKEAK
jgi:UDP-glucuronate 4-epimerase